MTRVVQGSEGWDCAHGPVSAEERRRQEQPEIDRDEIEPVELSVWSWEGHCWVVMAAYRHTCVHSVFSLSIVNEKHKCNEAFMMLGNR